MKNILAMIAFILAFMFVAMFILGANRFNTEDYKTIDYKVENGDTLWDIATRNCSNNDRVDDYIDAIIELNGIDRTIRAGQHIIIYIEK